MSHRPAYDRHDTDAHGNIESSIAPAVTSGTDAKTFEVSDIADEKQVKIDSHDAASSDSPPDYAGDDDGFGHVTQAETAKDLVTQVIHVEDDPSLSPYTFRLFVLGKLHQTRATLCSREALG